VDKPSPPPALDESHLDAIATQQTLLQQAHQASASTAGAARGALVLRYRRAIRGYLGALLQNDAEADELTQEVIVKMLQGGFAGFRSDKGRFRDYLKVAVKNTALEALRRRGRRATLDDRDLDAVAPGRTPADDRWLDDWRRTLLEGARQALHAFQASRPGNVYATVLDLLLAHPEEDGEALTARLAAATGQPTRPDTVRKQVSRARRKFAELLLEEVKRTLDDPTPEQVRDELIESGLLPYLRDFLPPDWQAAGETAKPEQP
jgi:RNA polymerase sigma factor (sigma-70 family)